MNTDPKERPPPMKTATLPSSQSRQTIAPTGTKRRPSEGRSALRRIRQSAQDYGHELNEHQHMVMRACELAESVLPVFEREYPDDVRPSTAILTLRRWLQGSAQEEECNAAAKGALAAARMAYGSKAGTRRLDEFEDHRPFVASFAAAAAHCACLSAVKRENAGELCWTALVFALKSTALDLPD